MDYGNDEQRSHAEKDAVSRFDISEAQYYSSDHRRVIAHYSRGADPLRRGMPPDGATGGRAASPADAP